MAGDVIAPVEFGPFRLDRAARELFRGGEAVPLPPKAMDLLIVLLDSPGALVTKADLMQRVWPDAFVEEGNLPVTIFALRKALGDDGSRYVKTVPRRGYTFVAPVRIAEVSAAADGLALTDTSSQRSATDAEVVAAFDAATRVSSIVAPEVAAPTIGVAALDATPASPATVGAATEAAKAGAASVRARARTGWRYAASLAAAAVLIWALLPFVSSKSVTVEATPVRSMAVAPFTVTTSAQSDELIGTGLSGDIVLRLSGLSELAIRPLASSAKYVGQQAVEVGRALQVDAVLTGAVTTGSTGVRISAELTRVADGARLWKLSADGEDSGLLETAGRIASEVAGTAVPALSSDQRSQLAKAHTASADAYRAYLAGLALSSQLTVTNARDGIERFEEAIRFDPSFADAHAELATLALLPLNTSATLARVARARAAADHALALDDTSGHAHGARAAAMVIESWDWTGASAEFDKAISLRPRDAELRLWHAIHLSAQSRHDEALQEIGEALALDPTSARTHFYRGTLLLMARRYDEAIAQFRTTPLELGIVQHVYLGMSVANAKKTRYDLARTALERVATRIDNTLVRVHRAFVHAEAGERAETEVMLHDAAAVDDGVRTPHTMFAAAEACVGRMDEAFARLDRARENGDTRVLFANVDPALDCARTDPRFAAFIKSLGLGARPLVAKGS